MSSLKEITSHKTLENVSPLLSNLTHPKGVSKEGWLLITFSLNYFINRLIM